MNTHDAAETRSTKGTHLGVVNVRDCERQTKTDVEPVRRRSRQKVKEKQRRNEADRQIGRYSQKQRHRDKGKKR